jgi:hypothetical protein
MAVGYFTIKPSNVAKPLTESWNGTTWSVVSAPDRAAGNSFLRAVTCSSSTNC